MFVRCRDVRIFQQSGELFFHARQTCLDRLFDLGVVVHAKPVGKALITVDVVHPSAVAFHQEAFGRAHSIVVQLHQIIAVGVDRRAPPVTIHIAWQWLTGPVDPVDLFPQLRFQPLGAMHAELLEDADILEQRLETPCLMWLAGVFGRTALELFGYGRRLERVHIGVAKQAPCHRDHICIFGCGKKRIKRAVAAFDIHEFIHVDAGHPSGVLNDLFLLGGLKCCVLRLEIHFLKGIVAVLNDAFFLQQVQHRVGPIGAIVGIDNKVVKPDRPMKSEPFKDKGAFVFHGRHDGTSPACLGRATDFYFGHAYGGVVPQLGRLI